MAAPPQTWQPTAAGSVAVLAPLKSAALTAMRSSNTYRLPCQRDASLLSASLLRVCSR